MDTNTKEVLRELYEEGKRNDEREQDRTKKMLNLEPETAQFLSMLVRSSQRKSLLEIGTSNGYSTIWLAWALKAIGGHVTSIDRNKQKHLLAEENIRKAQLYSVVTLLSGDATEIIPQLTGPFDCLFFDADRISAPAQLALLLPKLAPNALILADNVSSHPNEIANYIAALEALPQFEKLVVPIGKGLSIAYRM
jgi:predicted O-methyltransferase YrrM